MSSSAQPVQGAGKVQLITLGTQAGPAIRSSETGICSALVVGDAFYMVDFGLGCTRAAHDAGLLGSQFRAGFLTHLHSDHVVELAGFLTWNWGAQVSGFQNPVRIYGPGPNETSALTGTKRMMGHLMEAFGYDLMIRRRDEGRPDLVGLVNAVDVAAPLPEAATKPFLVHEDDRVRVTAVLVDHPPVTPAFGYRIDTDEGSVTFSGDTAECDALVELARDTDVLVHEAVNVDFFLAGDFDAKFVEHQKRSHCSPSAAGRVAARSGAGALVLSHLSGPAPQRWWTEQASNTYAGPVHVANSGDRFDIRKRLDHALVAAHEYTAAGENWSSRE